jgi:hypothetical protein
MHTLLFDAFRKGEGFLCLLLKGGILCLLLKQGILHLVVRHLPNLEGREDIKSAMGPFEGTLYVWISLLEKGRVITPTLQGWEGSYAYF